MYKENTQNSNLLLRVFFYIAIFVLFFDLFYVQAFAKSYIAEFQNHIELLLQFISSPFSFRTVHPGYHIVTYALSRLTGLSLSYSGIVILSLFVVMTAAMIRKILSDFIKEQYSESFLLFVVLLLLVSSSIYLPFFNIYPYLGQWSGNFYAVPTQVFVKPFALTAFLMFVAFVKSEAKQKSKYFLISIATVLSASTLVKPNFVFAFMPAVAVYFLLNKSKTIHLISKTIMLFLPVIIILLFQFYGNFVAGTGQGVVFTFFDVWREYSPNVLVSVLLAVAFPLIILIIRFSRILRNDYLILSWLFWFFGLIEFIFLAEKRNYLAANFSWSYSLGLWFLFIFSAIEYFNWLREDKKSKTNNFLLTGVTIILGLHFFSGLVYLIKQLLGSGYF